jgi:hypothetical protein
MGNYLCSAPTPLPLCPMAPVGGVREVREGTGRLGRVFIYLQNDHFKSAPGRILTCDPRIRRSRTSVAGCCWRLQNQHK